ncbi:hypothetical protein J3459_008406 [Metarhizium acridum]|nr:hypothetical protein J3459_008406 [Metarhizium acridum]
MKRNLPPAEDRVKKKLTCIRHREHQCAWLRLDVDKTGPTKDKTLLLMRDEDMGPDPLILSLVSFLGPRFSNRLIRPALFDSFFSLLSHHDMRTRQHNVPRKPPLELEEAATARPPKRA